MAVSGMGEDREKAKMMCKMTLWCVKYCSELRSTMTKIVRMLEDKEETMAREPVLVDGEPQSGKLTLEVFGMNMGVQLVSSGGVRELLNPGFRNDQMMENLSLIQFINIIRWKIKIYCFLICYKCVNSSTCADGNEDTRNTHGTIVPYSESKLAIEEMVMKETFSRNGPGSGPFFSTGPGNFSPGPPLQASPELCSAAVMEAKKWLEEKRQGFGSKPEDHGPCTLNTDVLNADLKSDKGSPVDLARSYMQSLPPWQSPLLGSRRFKSPPSGGVHINDEEGSKYFSSSKVDTKEDFISSSNFWENFDLQRDHIRFSETAEASKSRHHGTTSRLFDNGVSILSPGTRDEVGQPVQGYQGSDKVAAAAPANECSLPISPTKDGNHGAVDSVDPAPKDSGNLVQECHAASVHPDEVPQGNADEVPHGKPVPLTSATEEAADQSGDKSVPAEPEIHEELHMNSTSATTIHAYDGFADYGTVPESRAKVAAPQIRMSLRSLKKKVHTSLNGPTKKTSANGLLDRSDGNSGIESSGNDNPSCTNSSSAVPPNNKEFINSAADASADNSVDNGARTVSEKPADVHVMLAFTTQALPLSISYLSVCLFWHSMMVLYLSIHLSTLMADGCHVQAAVASTRPICSVAGDSYGSNSWLFFSPGPDFA
uniref:Uncharacterized protein n=1 Tax=Aegilops tauschii TaxID=37682 RepID=R7W0P6_AEGTA